VFCRSPDDLTPWPRAAEPPRAARATSPRRAPAVEVPDPAILAAVVDGLAIPSPRAPRASRARARPADALASSAEEEAEGAVVGAAGAAGAAAGAAPRAGAGAAGWAGLLAGVASLNAGAGALVVPPGEHAWAGDAAVRASGVNVTCAPGALLRGQWLLKDASGGSLGAAECDFATPEGSEPTVLVWGGPWLFERCGVRSAGGIAAMCAERAAVLLQRCEVGGRSGAEPASTGVSVGDDARCLLERCSVRYAGTPRGGGAGVRAMDRAKASLEDSTVEQSSYCVAIHGEEPRPLAKSRDPSRRAAPPRQEPRPLSKSRAPTLALPRRASARRRGLRARDRRRAAQGSRARSCGAACSRAHGWRRSIPTGGRGRTRHCFCSRRR